VEDEGVVAGVCDEEDGEGLTFGIITLVERHKEKQQSLS